MPRPDFPRPYIPLTPGMISRIVNDQRHYDENPERAEREHAARREREEEERQREQEERDAFDQYTYKESQDMPF